MTTLVNPGDRSRSSLFRHGGTLFGWSVEHHDGELRLSLGNSLVGVAAPTYAAPEIIAALERNGLCGPVIELNGEGPCSVFLADRNGLVLAQPDLPPRMRVWDCPRQVPLPPSRGSAGRATWLVAPDPRYRWLPTLAAVVAAASAVIPANQHLLRAGGARPGATTPATRR